jgi:2-succinyl-6-hydroxy-2,4-cyclohexadiene-1-carboxylate synthase
MPTLTLNQTNYAYEMVGTGEPILLLHGFTGCAENWREVAQQLADRFCLILLDLPGHGRTRTSDQLSSYTMPNVSNDLANFVERLVGQPVNVCGYSMGGRLALYFSMAHPRWVKSLILESASPGLENEDERAARVLRDDELARRIERDGIPAFVDEWEQLALFDSQRTLPLSVRKRLHQQRMQNDARSLALSLRGMGAGAQPPLWNRLVDLNIPVTLVVGEQDSKYVAIARRMATMLPQAQIRVVSNAGHTVHLEQPRFFCATLVESLNI